jgi:signal transduction histidine kinase
MQERLRMLEGTLTIISGPSQGTIIEAVVPQPGFSSTPR